MRRLVYLALMLLFIFGLSAGCVAPADSSGSGTALTADDGDVGGSDGGTSQSSGSGTDTSGGGTTPSTGTPDGSSGSDASPMKGIPDRISTNGGASFVGSLEAGEKVELAVSANQADVVTMRLERKQGGEWKPALFLYRSSGGSTGRERVAWHEPDGSGFAHIPYQDGGLQEGWEFYQKGTYELVLANQSETAGELSFELECLGGPCADAGSGGGGDGDGDGIAAKRDNCPETSNASQANRDHDVWGDACDPNPETFSCPDASGEKLQRMLRAAYRDHEVASYDEARHHLFAEVENEKGRVETVYAGESFRTSSIPNPNEYNTEHVWPQSKMRSDEGATVSDLHHLYPADAEANLKRSNLPFDAVTGEVEWSSGGSMRGENERGWKVFEPRDSLKGDVARAIFYYAVIYDRDVEIDVEPDGWGIGTGNESLMRKWHASVDPVSSEEEARNRAVENIQGTRNPFVDCPELVGEISDF